jgi:hypothetical protein
MPIVAQAIETSPEINELAKGLVIFQDKVRAVAKSKTARVEKDGRLLYTYQYADLADVIEDTREARTAAGLAVCQLPIGDLKQLTVVTTLLHSSGQWMRSRLSVQQPSGKPQEMGSLITYLRRYSYSAALGICTELDDDANQAHGKDAKIAGGAVRADKVKAAPADPKATDGQVKLIHVLKGQIGGMTDDEYKKALKPYGVTTSKDLTEKQAANLITRFEGMKDRQSKTLAARDEAMAADVAEHFSEREPGSDDDDGTTPTEDEIDALKFAAKTRWGTAVRDEWPKWLKAKFSHDTVMEMSRFEVARATEMVRAGS